MTSWPRTGLNSNRSQPNSNQFLSLPVEGDVSSENWLKQKQFCLHWNIQKKLLVIIGSVRDVMWNRNRNSAEGSFLEPFVDSSCHHVNWWKVQFDTPPCVTSSTVSTSSNQTRLRFDLIKLEMLRANIRFNISIRILHVRSVTLFSFRVCCGVPQGSLLGSCWFLLMDVSTVLQSERLWSTLTAAFGLTSGCSPHRPQQSLDADVTSCTAGGSMPSSRRHLPINKSKQKS